MEFFLACYTGVFALLLALFETRVSWTERFVQRLFGFLFSPSGRTLYIMLTGAIVFGLCDGCGTPPFSTACSWYYGVGFTTLMNALFNCFILCSHPGFISANQPDSSPTEEELAAYIAVHPELSVAIKPVESSRAEADRDGVPDWVRDRGSPDAAKPKSTGLFAGWGKPSAAVSPPFPANAPPPPLPRPHTASGDTGANPFAAPTGSAKTASAPSGASGASLAPQSQQPRFVPNTSREAPAASMDEDNPFASRNPF